VQLPLQHEGAISQVLILLVGAHDPPAVLDRFMLAPPVAGHGGRARPHPALLDGAGPGDVTVELGAGLHLRAGA
jgi:hypothetical protein